MEEDSRVVLGLGEEGRGRYYLMGTEFQLGKMKEVLEMDGGRGLPHCVPNATNPMLKNG